MSVFFCQPSTIEIRTVTLSFDQPSLALVERCRRPSMFTDLGLSSVLSRHCTTVLVLGGRRVEEEKKEKAEKTERICEDEKKNLLSERLSTISRSSSSFPLFVFSLARSLLSPNRTSWLLERYHWHLASYNNAMTVDEEKQQKNSVNDNNDDGDDGGDGEQAQPPPPTGQAAEQSKALGSLATAAAAHEDSKEIDADSAAKAAQGVHSLQQAVQRQKERAAERERALAAVKVAAADVDVVAESSTSKSPRPRGA